MFERLALAIISLAFISIFAVTFMYSAERRFKASSQSEAIAAVASVGDAGLVGDPAVSERRLRSDPTKSLTSISTKFTICHTGGGSNCVVDGDTVWIDSEKIRIADIDAPETHPPRCESEADLGNRATRRLAELMNVGPFELKVMGRDTDRYGRKLRVLVRDGRSLGGQLVSEGLARIWEGRRRPWC